MAYENPYTVRGNTIVRAFDGEEAMVAADCELFSLRRESLVFYHQRLADKRGDLRGELKPARYLGYLPKVECELAAINRVLRVLHELLAQPTVVKLPPRPLPRLFRLSRLANA